MLSLNILLRLVNKPTIGRMSVRISGYIHPSPRIVWEQQRTRGSWYPPRSPCRTPWWSAGNKSGGLGCPSGLYRPWTRRETGFRPCSRQTSGTDRLSCERADVRFRYVVAFSTLFSVCGDSLVSVETVRASFVSDEWERVEMRSLYLSITISEGFLSEFPVRFMGPL